jgi:hypothetical protein
MNRYLIADLVNNSKGLHMFCWNVLIRKISEQKLVARASCNKSEARTRYTVTPFSLSLSLQTPEKERNEKAIKRLPLTMLPMRRCTVSKRMAPHVSLSR